LLISIALKKKANYLSKNINSKIVFLFIVLAMFFISSCTTYSDLNEPVGAKARSTGEVRPVYPASDKIKPTVTLNSPIDVVDNFVEFSQNDTPQPKG